MQLKMNIFFSFEKEIIETARIFSIKDHQDLLDLFVEVLKETYPIFAKYDKLDPIALYAYNDEMFNYIGERRRLTDQLIFKFEEFNDINRAHLIYRLIDAHFNRLQQFTIDPLGLGNIYKLYRLHSISKTYINE